jgi:hypothetical protein
MADEVDDGSEEGEWEENNYEEAWEDYEQREEEEHRLRGFRFFWYRQNDEDEDDDDEDHDDEDHDDEDEDEYIEQTERATIPTIEYISEKLQELNRGFTYENLLSILLSNDHEEYEYLLDEEGFNNMEDNLFGQIRMILSNYNQNATTTSNTMHVTQRETNELTDTTSQPKDTSTDGRNVSTSYECL